MKREYPTLKFLKDKIAACDARNIAIADEIKILQAEIMENWDCTAEFVKMIQDGQYVEYGSEILAK